MTKEEMIKILQGLLRAAEDLDFLLALEKQDLQKLVSLVKAKMGS